MITDQQRHDALQQIRDCLDNGAEDCILALLTPDQIRNLAEDFNEGRATDDL